MIYVSKSQFQQVEYLIQQSIRGNHILFDIDSLREVFWHSDPYLYSEFSVEDAYSVEPHIERMILLPTLAQKKAYLENLDFFTFRKVVRTYFNIVENSLFENLNSETESSWH